MIEWAVDGLTILFLCIGMRVGASRLLRGLCTIALTYLIVFSVTYYLWLNFKYTHFRAHPEMVHVGISAAFVFEGFWHLLVSMILLQAVMPIGMVFLLYFGVKWLSTPVGPGSRAF